MDTCGHSWSGWLREAFKKKKKRHLNVLGHTQIYEGDLGKT